MYISKHIGEGTLPGAGDAVGVGRERKVTANQQAPGKDVCSAQGFRHFEGLRFVSSFLSAGYKDADLLLSFEQIFLRQLHAFDSRHLLQLLHICEQHNHRTPRLYIPLFRTLASQAPSLVFQEIADVFCCFASHRVGSGNCCQSLLKAAAAQVPNASLSDSIRLCGALIALGMAQEVRGATETHCGESGGAGTAAASFGAGTLAVGVVLALFDQRAALFAETRLASPLLWCKTKLA